jgi:hypothetical protein
MDSRRGEFEHQRNPIEMNAKLRDDRGTRLRQSEALLMPPRPIDERPQRFRAFHRVRIRRSIGQRQRLQNVDLLRGDLQRFAARGEDYKRRSLLWYRRPTTRRPPVGAPRSRRA